MAEDFENTGSMNDPSFVLKRTDHDYIVGSAELDERILELCVEILKDCRISLMMAFRFLDRALWQLPFRIAYSYLALGSNGRDMFFVPSALVMRFKSSPNETIRDYLHTLLHCVFRHPLDIEHTDAYSWGLACDIVVESIAAEMCARRFPGAHDAAVQEALEYLGEHIGRITPQNLYRAFADAGSSFATAKDMGLSPLYMRHLEDIFIRDSHDYWANNAKKGEPNPDGEPDPDEEPIQNQEVKELSADTAEEGDGGSDAESDDASSNQDQQDSESSQDDDEHDEQEDADENAGELSLDDIQKALEGGLDDEEDEDDFDAEEVERQWEEIAKQLEVDLETFAHQMGDEAGTFLLNLAIANRRRVNYRDFLQRFCVLAEDIQVNHDEFDYIFYTYGLDLYGNMPLIEPLEYQECNRVREFAIAIDTSGSCSGDLVKAFVARTCEILSDANQFDHRVNIHIIQCDARVQLDTVITSLDEMSEYADNVQIRGFGGTDFRPVFEYVDKLVAKKEFINLRGLIYFTDGYGIFPEKAPDYDTAFVFLDPKVNHPRVPPWALKIILDEDDIATLKE